MPGCWNVMPDRYLPARHLHAALVSSSAGIRIALVADGNAARQAIPASGGVAEFTEVDYADGG